MPARTFPPHADFETFLEATVLALIAVVLVYGTVPVSPACVGQVPPDAALKEALTPLTCELSVVLPTRFVPAHDALDVLALVFVHGRGGGGRRRRGGVVIVCGVSRGGGTGRIGRRCALGCCCSRRGYFQRGRRVYVSRQLPRQRQRCDLGHRGREGPLSVPYALGVSPCHHSHIDRLQNFARPTFLFTRYLMHTICLHESLMHIQGNCGIT